MQQRWASFKAPHLSGVFYFFVKRRNVNALPCQKKKYHVTDGALHFCGFSQISSKQLVSAVGHSHFYCTYDKYLFLCILYYILPTETCFRHESPVSVLFFHRLPPPIQQFSCAALKHTVLFYSLQFPSVKGRLFPNLILMFSLLSL